MKSLKGICVPICTPLKDSGELDEGALEQNIDSLISKGIPIIAVNGGTGEFPFLSELEKRRIAEVAAKRINGRASLIVQTSAIRTEDAIENSKHAEGIGADALLVLPPYFEGPGESGVYWHYEKIGKAVKTPLMVYNIPFYTQFDITPDIFRRLSEISAVAYIKDSTANFMRIEQLNRIGAKVFCGCDYLNFSAMASGAAGVFTGSGNVVPELLVELEQLINSSEIEEARKLWTRIQPISLLLWSLPFNPVAKAGSAMTGRPAGLCRKPVMPLSTSELQLVKEAVEASLG
jgi:4-hydroxy-tetrahydrodipicolinate synthase